MGVGRAVTVRVSEDGDASERYGDDGARISGGGRNGGRKGSSDFTFTAESGERDLSATETKQRLTGSSELHPSLLEYDRFLLPEASRS